MIGAPVRRNYVGGRRWRRHEIVRITIRDVRLLLPEPGVGVRAKLELTVLGHAVGIEIVDEPCATAFGGHRRWMRCPRCGSRANTLGVDPTWGWACPRPSCVGSWRGRVRALVSSQLNRPMSGNRVAEDFLDVRKQADGPRIERITA